MDLFQHLQQVFSHNLAVQICPKRKIFILPKSITLSVSFVGQTGGYEINGSSLGEKPKIDPVCT